MDVNKNLDKPNTEAVLFKNFSDEDFVGRWDSVNYSFPAGREIYVEAYKAIHFAKHLVDREIQKLLKKNKDGKDVPRTVNDPMRYKLEAKALPEGVKESKSKEKDNEITTEIDPSESVMNKNKQLEKKEIPKKAVGHKLSPTEKKPAKKLAKPDPKSLSELREIYESVHPKGNKPFPGWNAEILAKKIEGFKAGKGSAESGFEGA